MFVSVWGKGRFFSEEKALHVPVGTSTFLNCKYKKAEPSLELERSENCPCLYAKEISFCSYFCRSITRNSEDSSCLHLDDDIKSSAKVESNIHQKLIQMGKKNASVLFRGGEQIFSKSGNGSMKRTQGASVLRSHKGKGAKQCGFDFEPCCSKGPETEEKLGPLAAELNTWRKGRTEGSNIHGSIPSDQGS